MTEAFLVAEREPPAEASAIGSAGRDTALLPCALRGQRALLGAGAKFVVAVGGCGHGGSIAVLAIRQQRRQQRRCNTESGRGAERAQLRRIRDEGSGRTRRWIAYAAGAGSRNTRDRAGRDEDETNRWDPGGVREWSGGGVSGENSS